MYSPIFGSSLSQSFMLPSVS